MPIYYGATIPIPHPMRAEDPMPECDPGKCGDEGKDTLPPTGPWPIPAYNDPNAVEEED